MLKQTPREKDLRMAETVKDVRRILGAKGYRIWLASLARKMRVNAGRQ